MLLSVLVHVKLPMLTVVLVLDTFKYEPSHTQNVGFNCCQMKYTKIENNLKLHAYVCAIDINLHTYFITYVIAFILNCKNITTRHVS